MTYLENLAALAAVIGAGTGIASLIVSVNEVRQGRKVFESFSKVVKSYEQSVKSYEREVVELRKGSVQALSNELKMRDHEQKTRDQEWQKIKDIAKGVKHIMPKQGE